MAQKKKIMFINDLLVGGGVEKLLQDFVWHWHEKYEITVVTDVIEKKYKKVLPQDVAYRAVFGIRTKSNNPIVIQLDKLRRKINELQTKKFLRKEHFDVAIALKEGYDYFFASQANADKKYGWVHTDYHVHYYTKEIFGNAEEELRCMASLDGVICVADSLRTSIIDTLGDPGNLMVYYNPVDPDLIVKRSNEQLNDSVLGEEKHAVRFVSVGRIHEQKGYDLLLEACHILEVQHIPYELWIVGGADENDLELRRLQRVYNRLQLKNVKLLGSKSNPYPYIKAADWFISSSIYEGYSLVSQEAAVLDVPLLLTDCSGVRELLGDSEYGIVMEISVLDIYKNMKRVIEHPEMQEHYKQKIMERKKIISFDHRIQKIEELF